MTLKKVIIDVMNRDSLKAAVDELGLDGVDRRSAKDMAARLTRARRATPEVLLEFLGESQVKEVCTRVGLPTVGRRGALVKALLRGSSVSGKRAGRPKKPHNPGRKPGMSERKEPCHMNENVEAATESSEAPVRLPAPPPGMIRVTKTELVWPGKYNEDGTLKEVPRVSLPFQVIERVNESRATREAKKATGPTLFDLWEGKEGETFEEGWKNKLIWGDNLLVMGSLLEKFAGKIDLIYIDPPFATGADFNFLTQVGEAGHEVAKKQSVLEEVAYRDTWGRGTESYLSMLLPRLHMMRDLLSPTGSLVVHVDYRLVAQVRLMLDESFGSEKFRNEIVWHYHSGGVPQDFFPRKHDSLFWYCRGSEPYFDAEQASEPRNVCQECGSTLEKWNNLKRHADADGRVYRTIKSGGKVYRYYDDEPALVPDVWLGINHLQQKDPERTGFLTQKPEKLLRRVVGALSREGSLVADFFCGSGTTLAVAEKLGRRWIGCDLGRWAIHVTRKRLLGIENCKPFEVLNLGKYERQYWQGVTFGNQEDKSRAERALYEYLAFILKLYGAQEVAADHQRD